MRAKKVHKIKDAYRKQIPLHLQGLSSKWNGRVELVTNSWRRFKRIWLRREREQA